MFVLAGGAAVAQLINVVGTPILTRIFLPSDMGLLGVFVSFVAVAAVTLSLRYELAVVSATTAPEAARLLAVATLLVPIMAMLGSAVLWILVSASVGPFGALPLSAVVVAYVALLGIGAFGALRYWAVRRGDFGLVSRLSVAQSVVRLCAQAGLGALGSGTAGLLVGEAVGRTVGLVSAVRRCFRPVRTYLARAPLRRALATARHHWRYPALSTPSSVLDALAAALPALLIAAYFGIGFAGLFVLAQRVLYLPAAVVGSAAADVFHARLSRTAAQSGNLTRPILRTSGALLSVGLILSVVVIGAGEAAFSVAFGGPWSQAGVIAAALLPGTVAQLAVSPVSRAVFVLSGQRYKLMYDAAILAAIVTTLTTSHWFGVPAPVAILAMSVAQGLTYAFYLWLIMSLARRRRPIP